MKTSRKIRGILIWLLVTVLSVLAIYELFGSPALTPEMALRRKEKYAWVGPSEVIWEGESCHWWYDRLLLGETDYGYCFYKYDGGVYGSGSFDYVEKGKRECFLVGSGTVPVDINIFQLFAITDNPKAVRARLTLETECEGEPKYTGTYTAQAELSGGVFYQFAVDITDMDRTVLGFWAERLEDDDRVYRNISGTATLELFDREGNLIDTVVTEYPAFE